jgi:phage terminase large subunit-like protein
VRVKPKLNSRSTATSTIVILTTGVAKTMMTLAEYMLQMNNGNRNQVSPGARMRWIVAMKFNPVKMDEKPATNAARPALITFVFT